MPWKHLVVDGVLLRRQPPFVVEWCRTPDSKNVEAPCGYSSRACVGDNEACPRCGFRYCQSHYPRHVKQLLVPRDAWQTIIDKLAARLQAAARTQAVRIAPVPVPEVEVD